MGLVCIMSRYNNAVMFLIWCGWIGFGKSPAVSEMTDPKARVDFLKAFLKQKNMHRPVIVAPSMSGSYSIPFIMEPHPESCQDRVRGFVPIGVVYSNQYKDAQYHRCEVSHDLPHLCSLIICLSIFLSHFICFMHLANTQCVWWSSTW